MRINWKQLKNLVVETASGVELGHIFDVVFEIEGQLVAQYMVRSSIFSSKKYIISRDQIVRFEEEKMVVDDDVSVVKSVDVENRSAVSGAEPVVMREVE